MTIPARLRAAARALVEVDGIEVPARFASLEREVRAVRKSVALSASAHYACLRVPGEEVFEALDRLCPADLTLREGQLRHTLLLRDDGRPLVDLYLCREEDGWLLVAEGAPRAELQAHLAEHAPGLETVDLGATHTVLSLDGPYAWELLAALEGDDVIGFPYLTFYHPTTRRTYLRAGKTGEYGYDLIVPADEADELVETLLERGRAFDLALAGVEALWHCQLENWFFNVHREGRADLTPVELQLQWRTSLRKGYVGAAALRARRAAPTHRVTPLRARGPMQSGDPVECDGQPIGRVLHAERSATLGDFIAVGLLERRYAASGMDYVVRHAGTPAPVRTVSAPFVTNRSLFVTPPHHRYREREHLPFPGAGRD